MKLFVCKKRVFGSNPTGVTKSYLFLVGLISRIYGTLNKIFKKKIVKLNIRFIYFNGIIIIIKGRVKFISILNDMQRHMRVIASVPKHDPITSFIAALSFFKIP